MLLTPDDVIDLRDAAVAQSLLPGVPHPFTYKNLTAEQCQRLSREIFNRTERMIGSMMHDSRSDAIYLLFLEDHDGTSDDEEQWAEENGISSEDLDLAPWVYSHDGSREANLAEMLRDAGVV